MGRLTSCLTLPQLVSLQGGYRPHSLSHVPLLASHYLSWSHFREATDLTASVTSLFLPHTTSVGLTSGRLQTSQPQSRPSSCLTLPQLVSLQGGYRPRSLSHVPLLASHYLSWSHFREATDLTASVTSLFLPHSTSVGLTSGRLQTSQPQSRPSSCLTLPQLVSLQGCYRPHNLSHVPLLASHYLSWSHFREATDLTASVTSLFLPHTTSVGLTSGRLQTSQPQSRPSSCLTLPQLGSLQGGYRPLSLSHVPLASHYLSWSHFREATDLTASVMSLFLPHSTLAGLTSGRLQTSLPQSRPSSYLTLPQLVSLQGGYRPHSLSHVPPLLASHYLSWSHFREATDLTTSITSLFLDEDLTAFDIPADRNDATFAPLKVSE